MALKTSHLLGLLALGFAMLLIGWPWWLGIGIIVLSMAVAVGGSEESSERMRAPASATAVAGPAQAAPEAAEQPRQAGEKHFDDWGEAPPGWDMPSIEDADFKWSAPCDGIGGMSIKDPAGGMGIGPRTGTATLDINDIIRVKDDLRFKLDGMHKASTGESGFGWNKGAHTHRLYVRTGQPKRVWPYRTALQWKKPPKKREDQG